MTQLIRLSLMIIILAVSSGATAEGLEIIVNPESTITHLSRRQVIDLYMGRIQQFSNGSHAIRVDQLPASPTRKNFYQSLVGKSVEQINAYWARLLFSGRASPPIVMKDDEKVIKMVSENRYAIGYISSTSATPEVKVVLRVE